jgi:hypothetical protein
MKILFGDFNAKEGGKDICKHIVRNESLHEIGNDNGVIAVNFTTLRNLIIKSTMV